MEFDFANPMNLYAFACLRLTRKSYEFVFVCASLPIQSTSDDVPRSRSFPQAFCCSLCGSFGFRCLSFGLDAMAASPAARYRMRWSDEAGTESSGEEYMEDFKAKYKAAKSGHKGGLHERCEVVLREQVDTKAHLKTWLNKVEKPEEVQEAMKVKVPKEIVCSEHGNSSTIGLYRFYMRL